jgi:hypothetical protein
VELAGAPRRIPNFGTIKIRMSGRELVREFIDLSNDESICRTIPSAEVFCVVPLEVQLHAVAPYTGVFRICGRIAECGLEPQQLVEPNRRSDVADHQYWVNCIELWTHVDILLFVADHLTRISESGHSPNCDYVQMRYADNTSTCEVIVVPPNGLVLSRRVFSGPLQGVIGIICLQGLTDIDSIAVQVRKDKTTQSVVGVPQALNDSHTLARANSVERRRITDY